MFTLTDEEKEILQSGQDFARLQKSSAYQWMMKTMEYFVEDARKDHEDALLVGSPDTCLKYGIRFVERRLIYDLIMQNVERRIEDAKLLAAQLKQREEGQLHEHDAIGDPERESALS